MRELNDSHLLLLLLVHLIKKRIFTPSSTFCEYRTERVCMKRLSPWIDISYSCWRFVLYEEVKAKI